MPWDKSQDFIRSGHRSPPEAGTCRTITLSDSQGLKAVYCQYRDGWHIQSYLFSIAKGWTVEKAKAWFRQHHGQSEAATELHPDFLRIRALFIKEFGETDGLKKFASFIQKHGLDPEGIANAVLPLKNA